jgi:hypothetical protein
MPPHISLSGHHSQQSNPLPLHPEDAHFLGLCHARVLDDGWLLVCCAPMQSVMRILLTSAGGRRSAVRYSPRSDLPPGLIATSRQSGKAPAPSAAAPVASSDLDRRAQHLPLPHCAPCSLGPATHRSGPSMMPAPSRSACTHRARASGRSHHRTAWRFRVAAWARRTPLAFERKSHPADSRAVNTLPTSTEQREGRKVSFQAARQISEP